MRTLAAPSLLLAAMLLPGVARAADIKKNDLPSGRTYVSYRPRGLPDKPNVVIWLAHKGGADATAQEWKEKCSSIPVMAVFPTQDAAKGWRCYDWETQKLVKDRELAYLLEIVAHLEKEWDVEKKHIVVGGDESGGDYAFELALRYPEHFAGSIPVAPTWCATNKFEGDAKQARVFFVVGASDDRKKQAQDAHDRLRKNAPDLVWRSVEGLPKGMPPLAELARAVRWHQELIGPASEDALKWARTEWESGCAPAGIHLVGKLQRDKKHGESAKKLYAAIEKQAKKELEAAQRQPKFAQMEELWRLHDRYSPLPAVYDGILKSLHDVGATMGIAEKPPAAVPGSDDETAKILDTAAKAQEQKSKGDYLKAIETYKEVVRLTDQAELGAGEKKRLYLVAYYESARCNALEGKRQAAIEELTKAVDLGYDDWKQLESDKELDTLRGEGAFQSLLARRNK